MHHRFTLLFACAAFFVGSAACRDEIDPPGGGGSGGQPEGGGGAGEGGTAGGGADGGAAPTGDLTLMTWNLEQFPKTADTIDLIEEVLGELRPDVVGLQELDDEGDWQDLHGRLQDYEGVIAQLGDGYSRVGLLYRPDRVSVGGGEMVFADDSYAFPRPMLVVEVVSLDDEDHDFLFGVVHLKAQLDSESQARRVAAVTKLDQWMTAQIEAGTATDIVVAGDYNDQLTDPPQYNVFPALIQAEGGKFLTLEAEQSGDYSYIPFDSFIDHVYARGPALLDNQAQAVHLEDTVSNYVALVSDHRPVIAHLTFAD